MTQTMAQTYDNLWKRADAFQEKDQPRSEIGVMKKIIGKATSAKDYGQLLAAEMRQTLLWNAVSPDSLAPAIRRMETQAQKAQDPVLKAVWYAALGKLYREQRIDILTAEEEEGANRAEVNKKRSAEYFKKALENPRLLAGHASAEYEPLTLKGMDGSSFGNDLLHLIGFEADTKEAYQLMHDYYLKTGNRGAACLCAFKITQKDRKEDGRLVRKSRYLNTIDSIIHVYQDLPEAGELAVEHYRFMEGATDSKAADKINYINYALHRWGGWSRMNVLRNAQKQMTEPMFTLKDMPLVIRPGQKQRVHLQVRNLQNLKVAISRLDITADNDYDVNDAATCKMLLKKTSALHQKDFSRSYYGRPDYEEVKDSFEIGGSLPLGAYLMEVTSDKTDIAPQRTIFYVSDLALMMQQLPDDSKRYVVVSATTGQPIPGAQLLIYTERNRSRKKAGTREVEARLTTDAKGEAICKQADGDILVSTAKDKYTPAEYTYLSRVRYREMKGENDYGCVYTDRSIYRPGQTVHASVVRYRRIDGKDAKALADVDTKLILRDNNGKVIAEKTAKTDAYGTVAADFELPQGGATGSYYVDAQQCGGRSIRVEEYKRPTFELTFPKVNEKYAWGDTVVVKASAKTYAGVPVQGAKVSYTVTRKSQRWWWRSVSADQVVFNGEATTRDDGTFDVEIPLQPAVDANDAEAMAEFLHTARFFNFDVSATVTDLSGESHEGEMNLPLGTKPTAFSSDLPSRMEADSLKSVTFAYRNSAGVEIASDLKYRIDRGEWVSAEANKPVALAMSQTGVHELEAVCGQDTLQQKFTLFSMKDTHPVEHTTHWSYQTAKVFPRDGKPVYVQVGSSENGAHIVYSIIAGNKLLEKGAWELGDSIVTLPFTYKEEYASGIVVNYSFVKEGKCYTNMMSIARPLPEKKLNLAWKTFRNRLAPGQKEEWTLQITTPDGKPAKAQLMSVLYDKSLDNLAKHHWSLQLGLSQTLPNCYWKNNIDRTYRSIYGFGGTYPTKYYDENELDVDRLDGKYFSYSPYIQTMELSELGGADRIVKAVRYTAPVIKKHSAVSDGIKVRGLGTMNAKSAATAMVYEETLLKTMAVDTEEAEAEKSFDQVQMRENLNETAFFYPALETDKDGNVAIKFTLPESVTTWKFMGLAHDKEMRNGCLVDEAVARKTVMVQPNMPRFLREGDKATIVAKVFNSSERKVEGDARMQILDPETNKVVWQKVQKYSVDANGTTTLNFDVEALEEGVYINKVVVSGNGYSDGEQHYLPVLSNRELVTNTLPITLTEKGEKSFDLSRLFAGKDGKQGKNVEDAKVTVEYTNNPSWLMIQALPSLSNPTCNDNAISLMAAIYSNSIARHIMQSSPVIKQVVELWKKEPVSASLMSNLEKNQELKNILLNETPWVLDADKESEQKARLVNYFDESQNANRLASQIAKLKTLQNADGSFSWWKGMDGSRYMTTAVAKMMARLNKMTGTQTELCSLFNRAVTFLQNEAGEEVKSMKKEEAKGRKNLRPSEDAVDYLYILALEGRKLNASGDYLLRKMADKDGEFTIYGKAIAAVVLAKNNYRQQAVDYLKSINEYAVCKPGMGRYFDTRKAYYSWRDYKIPTQVAVIEAMQQLGDEARTALASETLSAKQAVGEMQLWLLQSKRTQAWDTPANSVDAVYAFLNGREAVLEKTADNATLKLDGKTLAQPKATAGLGYVKMNRQGTANRLTVVKKNEGASWGAVYAQFTQPSVEVASMEAGIKVTRKLVDARSQKGMGKETKVGDKVKVVLTITADRNYDFVQIADKRAACLEPVNQLSGWQWGMGCYISPRDNTTNFYFSRLSKGRHIVEMEYYVDRKGDYQSGSCAAQCAYSPEFGGRAEAYQLRIEQ